MDKKRNFSKMKAYKKVEIEIPVDLTDKELIEKGKNVAERRNEIAQVEFRKKQIENDYKKQIAGMASQQNRDLEIIRTGQEMRYRECYVYMIDKEGIKIYVDVETGKEVKQENMTPSDRQELITNLEEEKKKEENTEDKKKTPEKKEKGKK